MKPEQFLWRRVLPGLAALCALWLPALCALWLPAPAAQAQTAPAGEAGPCRELLASGNPQYPPYLWPDAPAAQASTLQGAAAELAQWLAQELGVPIRMRYVGPWARVQQEMRAGRLDLIVGAFYTQERTEYMDYVHPPFRQTRSVVWVGPQGTLQYRRWADLAGLRGATVINNSFGEAFDRYAKDKLEIQQVPSLEQAIQLLQRGRVDYLIYEDSPGDAYLARLGIKGVRQLQPPVATEDLYLTLSHRSACNTADMRGRLQRAMYKFAREGKLMDEFVQRAQALWRKQGPTLQ